MKHIRLSYRSLKNDYALFKTFYNSFLPNWIEPEANLLQIYITEVESNTRNSDGRGSYSLEILRPNICIFVKKSINARFFMTQYELYQSAIELLKGGDKGVSKEVNYHTVIDRLFHDINLWDTDETNKFLALLLNRWMKGVIEKYKLDRCYCSKLFNNDSDYFSMKDELDSLVGFKKKPGYISSSEFDNYHIKEIEDIANDVLAIIHDRGWDDKI